MKAGYKRPPKETQFKKGQSGNPGGISSETARLIRENAEKAALIRGRLLDAVVDTLESADASKLEMIEPSMLKLLKDAEDRGLGAPVQAVDHTTNGKDMPTTITLRAADNGSDG